MDGTIRKKEDEGRQPMLTYEQVKNNDQIRIYIQKADEALIELGYTCLLYTSRCV